MRWVTRVLSGLLMLVIVVVGLIFLVPSQKVAEVAAGEFLKSTGRVLELQGSVRPTVWPVLGVKTGPVTISNADWSDNGPFLVAEALSIGVDMAALIGGKIRITKVEAITPQILLERSKTGAVNWELGRTATQASGGGNEAAAPRKTADPVTLDHGLIHNGTLRYIDHASGTRLTLSQIEAELRLPDYAGEATLSLSALKDGSALLVDAKVAQFGPFLAGDVADVALSGGVGGSGFKFDGRLGTAPMVADGDVTADLVDLSAVMALAGQPVPDLPPGFGRNSRKFSGRVTLAPEGSVHLRNGVVSLDGTRFEGDADLTFDGPRPHLRANIKTGALTLAPSTTASGGQISGGSSAAAPSASGWSRENIDVSALGVMDAELSLSAESIDLGRAKLGPSRLGISIDRSRAVFQAREVQAYGGKITGQFIANGRGGLSVGGDLNFAGLSMQPLLRDVADFDRLIGQGDFNVKFLGVGNSEAAIINSLSGSGQLAFGKGELRGLDLVGMLRHLDPGYVGEGAKTIFEAVSASFTIKDGVLFNDDLRMSAPYLNATGQGRIGIGARDLDYRVVPTALQKEDGTGGVRVPVVITGPWSDPKYRLDLKALADEELKEKAKAEEARAKARLEAAAAEKLGVVRQEGESLEQAAKRRAKEALAEEAARALGKLFGGN